MLHEFIDDLNDPRLEPYRTLKDRELARDGDRFIAEGEHVVRRLLASSFPTESVLIAQRRLELMRDAVPDSVPLYVVPDALIHNVVGYKFHSGVIATGRRTPSPTVDEILSHRAPNDAIMLVVCPETNNTENLGLLIRIVAGFGADAMILGQHCCDPFYRQCIRVSMGSVFSLPIVQSRGIVADLSDLRERWQMQLVATVLATDAESLETVAPPRRTALLFGSEPQGLSDEIVALCDRRVTIPMKRGTDSFNVAVAAGIFLYHFTRRVG